MSRFFYIITKEKLPFKAIAHSHLMDFSLEDITKYVEDAQSDYIYYLCTPYVLSPKDEYEAYSKDLLLTGDVEVYQYFSWLIHEFLKIGSFKFIKVWEDNTKCDDGYCETFFNKCKHIKLDFNTFKSYFESEHKFESNISEDVLFIVK